MHSSWDSGDQREPKFVGTIGPHLHSQREIVRALCRQIGRRNYEIMGKGDDAGTKASTYKNVN